MKMYIKTEELKENIVETIRVHKTLLRENISENDTDWIEVYISSLKKLQLELYKIEDLEYLYNYYESVNDFNMLEVIAKEIVKNKIRIMNKYVLYSK